MNCGNGWGGNCCWWIIIILLLCCCCCGNGCGGVGGFNNGIGGCGC